MPDSEKLDDIDFDSFANELSDDDIQDPDVEPDTQYSSSSPLQASPSKKAKFTSFSTPTKPGAFTEIKNDPDSPFHSIKRTLFGGGGNVDSSPLDPPPSSPSHATPTISSANVVTNATDSLADLTTHLEALPALIASVQKEHEKDQRLIEVGKRKEDLWKKKSGKLEEENKRLKGDLELFKDKVKMLEEEVRELRTRR